MSMRHCLSTAALLLCTFFLPSAHAAEQVQSHQYASWAKFKPGTSVTMKQQMAMQGMTMEMEMHQELAEVTPEKAVVQMWTVTNMMGQKRTTPKRSVTLPAMVDKGKEDVPPGYKGKIEVIGDEKVTVNGKEYDCKVMHITGTQEGMAAANIDGKMWGSDTVPGRTVKLDFKVTGDTPMTMTGELAEVVIKE